MCSCKQGLTSMLDDHYQHIQLLTMLWHCTKHHRFNQCFGVFGILDYLHGTDVQFRSGRGYSRHVILFGLTPAKQLYPDPPKVQRSELSTNTTETKQSQSPKMSRRTLHWLYLSKCVPPPDLSCLFFFCMWTMILVQMKFTCLLIMTNISSVSCESVPRPSTTIVSPIDNCVFSSSSIR